MLAGVRKKSLSKGIIINLIATFVLRAISIITAPITTRLLETADYGSMSVFNTWVGIATIILGLQTYGTITNARVKYETGEEYFRYCWNAAILSLLGHVLGFALLLPLMGWIMSHLGLSTFLVGLLVVQSFMQNCVNMLSGHFLIENKAGSNLLLSAFISICSFGLSVLLIKQGSFKETPYMAFIIGHFIPITLSGLISFIWFALKGISLINVDYIKYCLSLSIPLIFHGLSGVVLGQSDRIMVERLVDLSEAGVYSLTYNFSGILLAIWGAINSIWVPFYFRFLKEKNIDELKRRMNNFDVLFAVLFSGFLFLSPEVFRIMDSKYLYQIDIIPVLLIGFYFNHLYGYPANYEFYKEKTIYLAIASFCSAAINIVLNFLLIPRYHAMGAAIATTLSYIIIYLFHTIAARCLVKEFPFPLYLDFVRLIPVIIVTTTFYILRDVPWIRWIIGTMIGIWYIYRIYKRKEII